MSRLLTTALCVGVLSLGALGLSGCSGSSGSAQQQPPAASSATASPSGSAATSGSGTTGSLPGSSSDASEQTQDVFSLSVGDCLNGTSAGEVSDVPSVDCAAPHDLEVFYEFDLTGDDYPGDSAVGDAAKAGCQAQFDSFVGIAYDDSALDFTEYTPTQQSWASGDRSVSCVVGDPNGKTTGTLAGAAR